MQENGKDDTAVKSHGDQGPLSWTHNHRLTTEEKKSTLRKELAQTKKRAARSVSVIAVDNPVNNRRFHLKTHLSGFKFLFVL